MAQSDDMKTITRTRNLRSSGGSGSVLTFPPILRELTQFEIGDEVELEAEVGSDEIVLRRAPPSDGDEGDEGDEN